MRALRFPGGGAVALFAFFALATCCLGCSTTSSRLKARFATEQGCPVDQVGVEDEGGTVYRASGCGKDTEYVCESFAGMGDSSQRCVERGLSRREPTGNPPPRNVYRPDLEPPK
ncbi:MAG TPA: hypothetical protein VK745_12580 [Polyangiaceae bacterium]|jgi:hypothetical protein|nr:hypothetical protein [Polyangiaceae bacterium]